jgi:hypothetical protein
MYTPSVIKTKCTLPDVTIILIDLNLYLEVLDLSESLLV